MCKRFVLLLDKVIAFLHRRRKSMAENSEIWQVKELLTKLYYKDRAAFHRIIPEIEIQTQDQQAQINRMLDYVEKKEKEWK